MATRLKLEDKPKSLIRNVNERKSIDDNYTFLLISGQDGLTTFYDQMRNGELSIRWEHKNDAQEVNYKEFRHIYNSKPKLFQKLILLVEDEKIQEMYPNLKQQYLDYYKIEDLGWIDKDINNIENTTRQIPESLKLTFINNLKRKSMNNEIRNVQGLLQICKILNIKLDEIVSYDKNMEEISL